MVYYMNIDGFRVVTEALNVTLPGSGEKVGMFWVSPDDRHLVDPASGDYSGQDYFDARNVTISTTGSPNTVLNLISAAGLEYMPDQPRDRSDDGPLLRFIGMGSAGNVTTIFYVDEQCPRTLMTTEE